MSIPVTEPRRLGQAGQPVFAAALALVLLPAGVSAVRDDGAAPAWRVALAAALIALHVGVATARRWPLPSFAVGGLACLVLAVAPDLAAATAVIDTTDYSPILLPSSLCFFPLLYAVSAHAKAPWPDIALGVGLAGCVLAVVRLWGFSGTPINEWAWWLLLSTTAVGGTLAAWALGRYRATRVAWSVQLAERVAADERRRIAREMHDVVAHSVAVMVSHAEAGRLVVPNSPERAPEILTTIAEVGREALVEMRGLLGVLRDEGSSTAPQPGLGDLPALVERIRAAGVPTQLAVADDVRLSPAVGLTVYRVVQEALTNVARHAGPGADARVQIGSASRELVITVTNTGAVPATAHPGRGLTGMRERVEAIGGTLQAGPVDGGWQVSAKVAP
ncbi:sensor histidine kinase [Mycobacterium sp. Root265]|uniref:sensor histidine kinase n=1 Tax=Mycobacterium sp. Root265 TaxID=1736504 RepID=UPI000B089B49|nr:histidine kinase [Mycobacterium sp. Root265]